MKKSTLIIILTIIFTILAVLPLGLFVFGLKTFFNTVEKVAPPNTIEQQEEQCEDSICECR
jgi:flagellar basal body-associated protein FliL